MDKLFILTATFVAVFFIYGKNVTFIKGKVEFANLDSNSSDATGLLEINATIKDQIIGTSIGSRIQFESEDTIWRLGSSSTIQFISKNHLSFINGSALICSSKNKEITIETISSKAFFNGSGTFLIETTSNGGFKFIPIEIDGVLKTEIGESKTLKDGRLLLVLNSPSELGDAFDIDLLLLLKSSRLINSYPTPLPSMGRIGLSVYEQQLRLKGKYDALIGDATSNNNLQMWKFGKKTNNTSAMNDSKSFFSKFFNK